MLTTEHRKPKKLAGVLIALGIVFLAVSFGPLVKDEIWFYLKELRNQEYSVDAVEGEEDSVFARFLSSNPVRIVPVDTEFSLVIERLGVNSPIIADVSVLDEKSYREALKHGVAHASVSDYPSKEAGNVYLFAHASLNFFDLGGYATVFNLLRKLNYGDKIHVFYKGDDYIYEVTNKEVLRGWDLNPLTRPVIAPILTLQTCDPPGTTINRFVATAVLKEVVPAE
jgi:sortase A